MANVFGRVYLVGAGPGDPGLLTVAGAEALGQADVVVYDYLANPLLLKQVKAGAELIYVGKSAGAHTLSQDEINALLVQKARQVGAGRTVVRLKGGDPYVFGRGGEEAQYLHQAGVEFVVVPGITAGIAGPAYAGIPVTQRNMATTMTLVTGHESEDKGGGTPTLDVGALSQLLVAGGTVVFYMGVRNLPGIAQQFHEALRAKGVVAPLPAAVLQWATRPNQRTVVGDVTNIAQRVSEAGITPPAIIVLGQVVQMREGLNWFELRPLFGQTVLVTRTGQQASELTAKLVELGAEVIEAPTIELVKAIEEEAIDNIMRNAAAYDWILFTSANGVRAAWERLRQLGLDVRAWGGRKIGAVGPATAEALEAIGIVPDLIPEKFVGEEMAEALIRLGDVRGKRFLLLRADIARPALRDALIKAGAMVDDVPIYQTRRPEALPEAVVSAIEAGKVNWITFTSASTAENLFAMLPEQLREKVKQLKKVSIGPVTSGALRQLGWEPTVEAERHDIVGLVEAIRGGD